jgi:hypothetical protein
MKYLTIRSTNRHMMKDTIAPISRDLLESELTKERFIRFTNKGNNEIYIVNHHNTPNVMLEIGRLREVSFRAAGGGTGELYDIDHYDTNENCYEQLIVYSREDREIIGGYRFIEVRKAMQSDGPPKISTATYFNFSEKFLRDYAPFTIELGRSWVQPMFQPSVNPRKGIFALDNIWDGLGALTILYDVRYFFGKVTMYPGYDPKARDILLYFMKYYFPDKESLMVPKVPLSIHSDEKEFEDLFDGLDYAEGFKILNQYVRNCGENIPPLVNIYMGLSPTMKTFGTTRNTDFGDVEETGIMVTIADVYPEKKERHINTFQKNI